MDDKYYNKKYLNAYNKIMLKAPFTLGTEIEVLTDFHSNGSYESIAEVFELLDSKDYAYMVRTTDLENDNFSDNVKYVTKKCYDYLKKSKVYGGELIINKIGSPGRAFLMPYLNRPVSLGMNQFMIRTNQNKVLEAFLWVYLNSEIGKKIIYRKVNGTVPLTMDKESIRSLPIPEFTIDFQKKIASYVSKANEIKLQYKAKYKEAEALLLDELDFAESDLEIDDTFISVRSYKQVMDSKRFDAEFFTPKYDKLLEILKHHRCKKIKDIAPPKKSIEPGSDAYEDSGIPFYRVSNISKYGSIGIAYKIETDQKAITSSALLHLKVIDDEVLPDYLALVLNSIIVKLQAERDAGGSIIQHWKPDEIEEVIIPIIDKTKQEHLSDIVKESFRLKAKSERIVDNLKSIVDKAIEVDEAEGEKLLSELEQSENLEM